RRSHHRRITQAIQNSGLGGQHMYVQRVLRNLERAIESCLLVETCRVTARERQVLLKIKEILLRKPFPVTLYFAEDSADLFSQLDEDEKRVFESLGFSSDKDLFDLPGHKTHRLVVTTTNIGPIIFNQRYFRDLQTSPGFFDLTGYLIHEMAHQTGLGFSEEAFIDRLALKVVNHVKVRGGEAQSLIHKGYRMASSNFVTWQEYFKVGPKKVKLNNVGELVLYSESHLVSLSEAIVTATPDWTLFAEGTQGLMYVGLGRPRLGETRSYREHQRVQVVQGEAQFILLRTPETGHFVKANYEILIPLKQDPVGEWSYRGDAVYTTLFGLQELNDPVVAPINGYKIVDMKQVEFPQRGLSVDMICPQKPLGARLLMNRVLDNPPKMADSEIPGLYNLQLQKRVGDRCEFFLSLDRPKSEAPSIHFVVSELLVFESAERVFQVAPQDRYEFLFEGELEAGGAQFKNLLVTWGYFDELQDTWVAKREVNLGEPFEMNYFNDPKMHLIIESTFSTERDAFCGGVITLAGQGQLFPQISTEVFLTDFFPKEKEEMTAAYLLQHAQYRQILEGVDMVGIFNMDWVRRHLASGRFESFAINACAKGFVYAR
ncbi:MAG: hypothetical protein AAF203_05650, partial [Pseudomonadota bacterium]